jgi:hypothetical protein
MRNLIYTFILYLLACSYIYFNPFIVLASTFIVSLIILKIVFVYEKRKRKSKKIS